MAPVSDPGTPARDPTRTIHHADAIAWLAGAGVLPGAAIVTSIPDVSEVGLSLAQWRPWFIDAARACVRALEDHQVALFFQTDIKKGGVWIDKSMLILRALEEEGSALLFRKVVCRKPPGTVSLGRPAYTHLLCASRALRPRTPPAIPDVLTDPGPQVWTRAMGVRAAAVAVRYAKQHAHATSVVDPFCGHGTIPAVANALGLDAVGVELNRKRCAIARALTLTLDPPVPAVMDSEDD
jgi:hypothetical protein